MEGIKMKCRRCQFANPDGVNFCVECGSKLEKICPECGYSSSLSHNFCGGCGRKLSLPVETLPKDLSFDEKLTKIQRYLPKGLTEKILSQKDRIEGERKQVTVMFCDMEGFTNLSERAGPEEAFAIMDQVYEILIHKVHDYEGTVNEMTGDGIMALFGAPIALEDAPQRAIRSSLSIHREIAKLSDKIRQEKENLLPFKMRVGIHTGPVVVGTLGNELRVEFKAVGDTVNLASRMEALAEPGCTYMTEDTFKLTEGFFRFEALGEKAVKGKKEPIRVYRVIAPITRRTRFDVSAERGLTPFVGQKRELEILLDAFQRARAGRGQAISIMSEAGVGKSRLLYEFRKAVANEDATFLEGKCLSYSRGIAYHLVIDVLKSNFNVQEGEGDSEIRRKVKSGIEVLGADEATTLPYLLELLSVKDSGVDKIMMSPEGKKDRIIEALKRIVLKGSEIRPIIMALEDLHWVDKSSEEVLKYVLESIPGLRVLLLLTYRPEFVHTWGTKSFHHQLMLNRLSNRESLTMVTHLLGTEDIDGDLKKLILEKIEGVPFFIEEFIKSLKELKVIESKDGRFYIAKGFEDVAIPSTIQEVIMARVDSLPEDSKELLQTGSAIEREFSYKLIKRLKDLKERELLSQLSVLKDSEFLYERGIYPQSTYIFKHALTREVVYDSILTRRKKKLHREIGDTIEGLYRNNINEHSAVLVHHFMKGGDYQKGSEYSRLAGRKAEKTGSLNDAIAYCKKRIACLERLPELDHVQKNIIDARTVLGLYYIQTNYHVEAKEAVDPIIESAIRLGYKTRLSQIYTILGAYHCAVEENFPQSLEYLQDALRISKESNDILSLFMAKYWLGILLSFQFRFEKALSYLEEALEINVKSNSLWGISAIKSVISYFACYFPGKVNLGYHTSAESIQIAEESGDIYSKALAQTTYGISCFTKGFLQEAIEHLLRGSKFCQRIKILSWDTFAQSTIGDAYFEIGEYEKSKQHFNRALQLIEQGKFLKFWRNLFELGLAKAKIANKKSDINLESVYRIADKNRAQIWEGLTKRYVSEILFNFDDQHLPEAEFWIKKAIEADKRNGMMWLLGRDYAICAEIFKRKDDYLEAREYIGMAIEILKECGADGWVQKAEKRQALLA
jgi:class 3 adenylate cyclase/tetratricopeptide (TPR) repeat protein